MGAVYEVAHSKLGKSFALKQIRGEQSQQARQHFYREAHFASALSHPSFPAVVDFGEDPRFGMYMVSEFVEGLSLSKLLASTGPLRPMVASTVLLEIAEALQYLHGLQLTHGDIKGSNVMITPVENGRSHQVKIIDLGLARSRAVSGGMIAGTPPYAAPEMRDGTHPCPRTDLYALGVLTNFVVAGSLPRDDTVMESSGDDDSERAPVPSESSAARDASLVLFDDLVRRSMADDPDERYQSAGEYIEDLRDIMRSLDVRERSHLMRPGDTPIAELHIRDVPIPMAVVAFDSTVLTCTRPFAELVSRSSGCLIGARLSSMDLATWWPELVGDIALAFKGRTVRRSLFIAVRQRERLFSLTVEAMSDQNAVAVVVHPWT